MDNYIGDSIRYLRNKNNMKQEILAERLHVSRQAISNWENGKSQPDADKLIQISMIFQVSVDEIVKNSIIGNMNNSNKKGLIVLLCAIVLSSIQFILGICGLVNLIGVIVSVGFAAFISVIMHVTFESSINSNDFTMIAGYKKLNSNNYIQYAKQLRTMSIITSFNTVFLNILYVPVYFMDVSRQPSVSIIYFAVSIVGLVVTILVAKRKYK